MSEKKDHLSEETSRHFELPHHVGPARERGRWGRPNASHMRRTAARIRAGTLPIHNKQVPPSEIAEVLEEMAEQEFLKSVKIETLEFERACRELDEKRQAERECRLVAELLRLKSLPEAHDPESPVAKKVRELNRMRRNELGRPRKRRRKA